MAGPTCVLVFAEPESAEAAMTALMKMVGELRTGQDFDVTDTRPIGGSYIGAGRPFLRFACKREPEDAVRFEQVTGFAPVYEIGLAAMCNRREDHRVLAEMALWLAGRLGGFIDAAGDLEAPDNLPGQTFLVPYDTASGWESHTTIFDAVSLAGWMQTPDFRMVK